MLRIMRVADFVSIFFVFCVYVIGCFVICSEAGNHWEGIIVDDAYYYLGLARSIVTSGDSVFLPPFASNGYQPLWLFILVVAAKMFGTSNASLVFQIFSLSYLFFAVFCFVSKKVCGYVFPAVACAFAFPDVAVRGMETALIPVLVLLLFSSKLWWVKGGVSSLLFLARLDTLALIFFEMIYSFFIEKKRDVRGGFILLAVVGAYFSVNYLFFGSVVPVSGLSKSVGNVLGENYGVILSYGHALKPVVLLVVVCLPIFLIIDCRVVYKKQLVVSAACLVSEALYYGFCSGWPVWGWYMWPVMILAYFSILNIVQNIENLAESRGGYDGNMLRKVGGVVFVLLSINLLKPTVAYCKGIVSGIGGGR